MSKQIRLCFSGSGFRFPAHVGALSAVEEMGYEVIEVSGTSGGSIIGSMIACGKTASQLKDITFNTDFGPMLEWNPGAVFNYSYCNGLKMIEFVKSIIGPNRLFGQTLIPLHIVASNLTDNSIMVFNKPAESVATAVKASTAVPFIYSPVRIDGHWLVDGGICANTPVEILTQDSVLKLAVKLTSDMDTTPIKSAKDILLRTANLLFESNDNAHVSEGLLEGALFSFVNTGSIGSFNSHMTIEERQTIFDSGYNKTKEVLQAYEDQAFTKTGKPRSRGIISYSQINHQIYG